MKNGFFTTILRDFDKKSWERPNEPSTSTSKLDIHEKKFMLCIWWDQVGVVYYQLQSSQSINAERYQRQLLNLNRTLKERRTQYIKRHDKVILLHDNARSHVAESVKEILEALEWDVLPHPPSFIRP